LSFDGETKYVGSGTIDIEGSIKVHSLVLGMVIWNWSLHVCPFSDEVDKRLGFDRMTGPVLDGISAELDHPLDDVAAGFLIVEDISKRILHDHSYVEGIKVVVKLSRCYQDCVEQFLNLKVPSSGLVQDFTDEVD
jgi:hypothetical protein